MLHWLPFFKTLPLDEIRLAQHLNLAHSKDASVFVKRQRFDSERYWSILHLAGNAVYWGKIKDQAVSKRRFYKTPKNTLEQALMHLPNQQQLSLNRQVKRYLSSYFDRIDGQLLTIDQLQLQTLQLSQEGHYEWTYRVDLTSQSTGLGAQPQKEQRQYQLTMNGETGQLLSMQEAEAE